MIMSQSLDNWVPERGQKLRTDLGGSIVSGYLRTRERCTNGGRSFFHLLALMALAGSVAATLSAAAPAAAAAVTLPDLQIKVPTNLISIGTDPTSGHRMLRFTHITWDAGTG